MPKKLLIRTADFPYHITNRSNNKEFFYVNINDLWSIFIDCMSEAQSQFQCRFHAFVLMSNHYHLLLSTPLCNVDKVLQYVQREVARKANKKTCRINHFFGGAYKWSVINYEACYWNTLKYIFRNPVRAGLCSEVKSYPFSSLNFNSTKFNWLVQDHFNNQKIPIDLDVDWLNEPFFNEVEKDIRMALRRREFKIPRNQSGHRRVLDEPRFKKGVHT